MVSLYKLTLIFSSTLLAAPLFGLFDHQQPQQQPQQVPQQQPQQQQLQPLPNNPNIYIINQQPQQPVQTQKTLPPLIPSIGPTSFGPIRNFLNPAVFVQSLGDGVKAIGQFLPFWGHQNSGSQNTNNGSNGNSFVIQNPDNGFNGNTSGTGNTNSGSNGSSLFNTIN